MSHSITKVKEIEESFLELKVLVEEHKAELDVVHVGADSIYEKMESLICSVDANRAEADQAFVKVELYKAELREIREQMDGVVNLADGLAARMQETKASTGKGKGGPLPQPPPGLSDELREFVGSEVRKEMTKSHDDLSKRSSESFAKITAAVDKLRGDFDHRPMYADEGGRRSKDWTTRIVDRKNFKEKVNKFEGKGGELEVKSYIFSLKMFLCEDRRFLEMLKLLEKRDAEVDLKLVKELQDKGWDVTDMNSQLYQILCDCALPKSTA